MKSFEETWIGEGVDYNELWNIYEKGKGYINKFKATETTLVTFSFNFPDLDEPLFNHDAVYNSLKGLYHDYKKNFLSKEKYEQLPPMFLYGINRGSAEYIIQIALEYLPIFLELLRCGIEIYQNQKNNKAIEKISDDIEKFIRNENLKVAFMNLGENLDTISYNETVVKKNKTVNKKIKFKFNKKS